MFVWDSMSFQRLCLDFEGTALKMEERLCNSERDALLMVTCPQGAKTFCGEVVDVSFPQLYSTMTTLLYFTLACKNLLYLHFAVGAFGNDHMNDLSSQKVGVAVGVAAVDWSLQTRLLFFLSLSLSLCATLLCS